MKIDNRAESKYKPMPQTLNFRILWESSKFTCTSTTEEALKEFAINWMFDVKFLTCKNYQIDSCKDFDTET